jgi:carbamate kinase
MDALTCQRQGNDAVIGSLTDIADIVAGKAGTRVRAAGGPSAWSTE